MRSHGLILLQHAWLLASGCAAAALAAADATTEPCAVVSAAYASQIAADPQATPTIAASVAYDCLQSVPLGKDEAVAFVDSIEPYLEWQTDSAYKADPPSDYYYPAFDMFTELATVRTKILNDEYAGEYDFQDDLYKSVFCPGHDGHYVLYPDLLSIPFDWNRPVSLVSISDDQSTLPVIKVYEDVISDSTTASVVTQINGVDAEDFLVSAVATASWNHVVDAAYNSLFFELATEAAGLGKGYFQGSGRLRYVYQGATTNLTFANGTEVTLENYAHIKQPLTGVTDGASMYTRFCNPNGFKNNLVSNGPTNDREEAVGSALSAGYPTPVVQTNDSVVAGFFIDDEDYDDVAVISVLAFENESPPEFQSVVQEFFSAAVAAGKTKLIIDFQGNAGGYILQGYDFFRQLFPSVMQDGFSRWKENDGFVAISEIISDLSEDVDPYTSDNDLLISLWESVYNYQFDYDVNNEPFDSYEAKFTPAVYKDDNFTQIMRWNLDNNLTTSNTSFGIGFEMSGYGARANLVQPFLPEDIIILYDGVCASTCTIASEMLRLQAGVQSIAMGGLPQAGPIQGIGGVKGAQVAVYSDVLFFVNAALENGKDITDDQRAALSRYNSLATNRSSDAALNVRDQILRDNLEDGVPAQYVAEYADCRLYWTLPMITDITEQWKAVADAAFFGGPCAEGEIVANTTKRAVGASLPRAHDLW